MILIQLRIFVVVVVPWLLGEALHGRSALQLILLLDDQILPRRGQGKEHRFQEAIA
jgi:hypothetical protein